MDYASAEREQIRIRFQLVVGSGGINIIDIEYVQILKIFKLYVSLGLLLALSIL